MTRIIVAVSIAVVCLAVIAVAVGVPGGRGDGGGVVALSPADAEGGASPGPPTGAARVPVLVELFTSEGCSSCPPADAVLARLERTQPVAGAEVIPVSFHVDYWNYIGWADPFSSARFSERQGEYARAYGKDGVYTPQMIVDGVKEFPGGNAGLAADSVERAARTPKAVVRFDRAEPSANGAARLGVRIEGLPKPAAGEAVYVLLAVTEGGLASDVRRGENAGRKLAHVGVVRSLATLGPAAGGGDFAAEASVKVERNWKRENLRAVVFAQESGSRRILAAGSVKLYE